MDIFQTQEPPKGNHEKEKKKNYFIFLFANIILHLTSHSCLGKQGFTTYHMLFYLQVLLHPESQTESLLSYIHQSIPSKGLMEKPLTFVYLEFKCSILRADAASDGTMSAHVHVLLLC